MRELESIKGASSAISTVEGDARHGEEVVAVQPESLPEAQSPSTARSVGQARDPTDGHEARELPSPQPVDVSPSPSNPI